MQQLRPYYRSLARLYEHYAEVDALLSGELPSTIAQSFYMPQAKPTGATQSREGSETIPDADGEERPEWLRRGSVWKVHPKRVANGAPVGDEEEAGEGTALLGGVDKEEKRERLAKVALNGKSLLGVSVLLMFDSQYGCQRPTGCSQSGRRIAFLLDLPHCFTGRLFTRPIEYIYYSWYHLGDRCQD